MICSSISTRRIKFVRRSLSYQNLGLEVYPASILQVQERSVKVLAAGQDVVVAAETGSGKTLAYLVPIISQLLAGRPISADTDSAEPDKRCAIPWTHCTRALDHQILSSTNRPGCSVGGSKPHDSDWNNVFERVN